MEQIKIKEEILICTEHEKQVPLIWTFAFNGSEYWCPYCGYNGGMFGTGKKVPVTSKLKSSLKMWEKKSEAFLDAKSTFVCSSMEFEGKRIKPQDLPDVEKIRLKQIITDWEYESKI